MTPPPDREPGSDDDDPTPAIDLEALRQEEEKLREREPEARREPQPRLPLSARR